MKPTTFVLLVALLTQGCSLVKKTQKPTSPIAPAEVYKNHVCKKRDRSLQCYNTAPGLEVYPVSADDKLIVSFKRHSKKFQAVDVRCAYRGEPVRAVADGVVQYIGQSYMIRLQHDTSVGPRRSVYTHIQKNPDLRRGMKIQAGDLVGRCDVRGITRKRQKLFPKGVLHFEWQRPNGSEYKRIDPLQGRRKYRDIPRS
jgi:hypothetical protein